MEIIALLTGLSTIFAFTALIVAWSALRQRSLPRRRIEGVELALDDLTFRHEALQMSFKKLNSRVAMRQARAAAREKKLDEREDGDAPAHVVSTDSLDQLPGETANAWKMRVRQLIASGKVGPQTGS